MSVRVRVTAVAVVVTAVALAIGGWGLVRSIESTRLGQVAAENDRQLELVADRLEAGASLQDAVLLAGPGTFVQVLDDRGDVLTASSGLADEPLLIVSSGGEPGVAVAGQAYAGGGTAGGGGAGATRIDATFPGTFETAIPVDLQWEQVATPSGDVVVATASPLAEVGQSLDAVRHSLWIGFPLVVALVGIVAWVVTGRALDPVESMRVEAEAITDSTLHRRVPDPGTHDEVGRLARTLNAMLDRLEGSAERQRRFVADASHELRTPVATLRTELEVAQLAGDEESLRRGVADALAEEQRLEDLLADLLLLASVEEPSAARVEPVDLATLALAEAERHRRVPITVTGAGTATGSRRQFERVVRNLLDNAARHASTAVTVTVDDGTLVVEDDGPGVPEADREHIFERFTRLDEGRARDAGGSGLGLSIVRAVTEAHGGSVSVDASPILGGARFTVALPR